MTCFSVIPGLWDCYCTFSGTLGIKALCRWHCRPREARTIPSCYCLLTKGFATQNQGWKQPGTPTQGRTSRSPPAPVPHMGILHPHWSFLLYFLNAREAVKLLMLQESCFSAFICTHPPAPSQPTELLICRQRGVSSQRASTASPHIHLVPDGPLGGLTLAMCSQLPPSTLTHVTSAFFSLFPAQFPILTSYADSPAHLFLPAGLGSWNTPSSNTPS